MNVLEDAPPLDYTGTHRQKFILQVTVDAAHHGICSSELSFWICTNLQVLLCRTSLVLRWSLPAPTTPTTLSRGRSMKTSRPRSSVASTPEQQWWYPSLLLFLFNDWPWPGVTISENPDGAASITVVFSTCRRGSGDFLKKNCICYFQMRNLPPYSFLYYKQLQSLFRLCGQVKTISFESSRYCNESHASYDLLWPIGWWTTHACFLRAYVEFYRSSEDTGVLPEVSLALLLAQQIPPHPMELSVYPTEQIERIAGDRNIIHMKYARYGFHSQTRWSSSAAGPSILSV